MDAPARKAPRRPASSRAKARARSKTSPRNGRGRPQTDKLRSIVVVAVVGVAAAISVALQLRASDRAAHATAVLEPTQPVTSAPPAPDLSAAIPTAVEPSMRSQRPSAPVIDRTPQLEGRVAAAMAQVTEAEQARQRGDAAAALRLARQARATADAIDGDSAQARQARSLAIDAEQIEAWATGIQEAEESHRATERTLAQARSNIAAGRLDEARTMIESTRAELEARAGSQYGMQRVRDLLVESDALLRKIAVHAHRSAALSAADRQQWLPAAVAYDEFLSAGGDAEGQLAGRLFFNASIAAACDGGCDLTTAKHWADRAAAVDTRESDDPVSNHRWALTLRAFDRCDFNLRATCGRIRRK